MMLRILSTPASVTFSSSPFYGNDVTLGIIAFQSYMGVLASKNSMHCMANNCTQLTQPSVRMGYNFQDVCIPIKTGSMFCKAT